ncbi:MAG TPA: VCBS repeat-containing protein [Cyclobacteriaceae bacterium]|nr:VCBS repeat-containing protein [Cyclobacteriaceae bacterium]
MRCKNVTYENARFMLISSDHSNITFSNNITESDSLNILSYEYLYNGGGVGVLDVNNDGLNDLFFTGNMVPGKLYLNKGNLVFEDITESSNVLTANNWTTGVSIVDVNNDGFDDIYVCVGGTGNKSIFRNKLYINQHNLTFKESAHEYGLDEPAESVQATFFDYDKDGDLDMYLLTGGGFEKSAIMVRPVNENGEARNTDRLYQNNYDSTLRHAVFTNISAQAHILTEGFGLGVAILDANEDMWPDVYVSNDYLSRDQLLINNHDGTFTDQSLARLKHTSHFSMGNDVGDINNDGLEDIITVDMLPENHKRKKLMFGPADYDRFYMAVNYNYGYQYMRNMLQLNLGNGNFSEIGQLSGIHSTDWSWAPLLADFDNDGFQDLYVTNGYGKDVTDLDFVKFRNDVGSTSKSAMYKLLSDSLRERPAVSLPDYIYHNNGDLTFQNKSSAWGINQPSISNGAVYADLDNDGDLEIILNNLNDKPFLYKNNTVETDSANFVRLVLNGPKNNVHGIGATVKMFSKEKQQIRSAYTVRGFLSSVENTIHFGLGHVSLVDSAVITWPDHKQTIVKNIKANQTIHVNYQDADIYNQEVESADPYLSPEQIIAYQHKDYRYNDFSVQPLLMQGCSTEGPGMAVGDVNNDGLDDIFIGGAYQSSASIFLQKKNGRFTEQVIKDDVFEDTGCIFFDSENDGDLDLYIASGGDERYTLHAAYQDRLYVNDGKGNFTRKVNALPDMLTSTSVVSAADFDQDGDLDLFVGGRVSPGEYPKAPLSYILENNNGIFTDVTAKIAPALRNIGMVTSATWTDFDNDFKPDLIVVGEFMRISVFRNNGNTLTDITDNTELKDSYGMWNSIQCGDFDNDGDTDYVVGNIGYNNAFHISADSPLSVYYADFDNNHSVDPIFSIYEEGKEYPFTSLDQLTKQIPSLRKQLLYYRTFATITAPELLNLFPVKSYSTLRCKISATSFIENRGNGKFKISPLPMEAQVAPVNGIVAEDFNQDGLLDIAMIGNKYNQEVVSGRFDSSYGLVLFNKSDNHFESLKPEQSGLFVNGDGRALVRFEMAGNKSAVIASVNNEKVSCHIINNTRKLKRITWNQDEVFSKVMMANGKTRKTELYHGGGYLSQQSRTMLVSPVMREVKMFNDKGKLTRSISVNK